MTKKIAVLPGDGIGPEVVSATVSAIDALSLDIEFINADIGFDCHKRTGNALPKQTLNIIDECDAILVGCVNDDSTDRTYRNPVMEIKKRLDLFANVRPIKKIAQDVGVKDLDIIVIREYTEGLFSMNEIEDLDGVTHQRRVSYKGCKRICQFARNLSEYENRKKITCVHKANVYKIADGLFKNTFYEVMTGTKLKIDDTKVDDMAAEIVLHSDNVDVITTMSMYGDILSREAAALVGGAYLCPSGNYGVHKALFEPLHKSNPELVGLNIVNPTGSLLSGAMLLEYLGMPEKAEILRDAVLTAYKRGYRTKDVGGTHGTYEFSDQIAKLCENPQL